MIQRLVDLMSRALEGLAGLPWGVHVAVAAAMAAGLIIWALGERLIKPMTVLFAGAVGGIVGLLLTPLTPWGSAGAAAGGGGAGLAPYIHLGVGAGIGAIAGLLMFRSAMALGMGIVTGALLPLAAAAILIAVEPAAPSTPATISPTPKAAAKPSTGNNLVVSNAPQGWTLEPTIVTARGLAAGLGNDHPAINELLARASAAQGKSAAPGAIDQQQAAQAVKQAAQNAVMTSLSELDPVAVIRRVLHQAVGEADPDAPVVGRMPENLEPAVGAIQSFWRGLSAEAGKRWSAWSLRDRAIISMAGALGLAFGVIAGLSLPAWAAGSVTSLFGAAIWIPSIVWLSSAMNAPWKTAFDRPPAEWLLIWVVAGIVGLIVQVSGIIPGAKKRAGGGGGGSGGPKPATAK